MGYIIAGVIVGLIVNGIAAIEFESIAAMKGYKGYFWWCFLLGIIGWLMVIALPDRGKTNYSKLMESRDAELPDL